LTSKRKRETIQRFDEQAPYYGSHLETVGERIQIEVERRAIFNAIRRIRFGRALDVGCGPGRYLVDTSKLGDVIGLDISPNMTTAAKKSLNSDVLLADMEFLPFRDDSFDLIYSVRVMKYLQDPSRFILEARRICDESGCILLYDIRHIGLAYLGLRVYMFLRKIVPPKHHPNPHQLERLMPFQIGALLGRSATFRVKSRGVLFIPWLLYRHINSPKALRFLTLLDRLLAKAPLSQYLGDSVLYTAIRTGQRSR
jgi:SAM-dependent methyltransferase